MISRLAFASLLLGLLQPLHASAVEPPEFEVVAAKPVVLTFDEAGEASFTVLAINRTDDAVSCATW